jgi:hypothetical protein
MFKRISVSFIFLLFSQFLFAQQIEISGKIADTTSKSNVRNAIVMLLSAKDSVIKKYTRTDTEGKFSLDNITKGSYVLMVMHPLFADYVDNVDIDGANIMVGTIAVTPKSKLLEAVIIKSGSPIKIKGDTTIYTADSFKVSANASRRIAEKLPIQVIKRADKAMGETRKSAVDGESFWR